MTIVLYVLVGVIAQVIACALRMAYGISSNTCLLRMGVPPAPASARVHMAEVATTGVSGFSHWRLGNIDWRLVKRLVIPGVIGGVAGAYLLTSIDGNIIKPFISAYLLIMGIVILVKAFNIKERKGAGEYTARVNAHGLVGGFFDASGGGGWGHVLTTTLMARSKNPRITIGSVNFSEFFITFAESVTFILTLNFSEYWQIILGLLVGGAIAAPLAARMAKHLPVKTLMIMVGTLIILLSIRTIYLSFV